MTLARKLATAIALTGTLCAAGGLTMAPAASAGRTRVITVGNDISYEHQPTCSNTTPFPCGPTALTLRVRVFTNRSSGQDIRVGWQISGGTATPGQDFSGPTSGTAIIAANTTNTEIPIPLVSDGFGEATETFTMRLTSSNVSADISSVGTETILDGSQIPSDCTLTKNAPDHNALTCTNRPAGQRWYLLAECFAGWGDPAIRGNDVIGNGTSAGNCGIGRTTTFGASFRTY